MERISAFVTLRCFAALSMTGLFFWFGVGPVGVQAKAGVEQDFARSL
jgi:hypothetical protein